MRAIAGLLAFCVVCASGAVASAADEVTTLETQLGRETTELSTSDCAAACKALASIRRASDRICELEPGPRCEAARAKAEDATKKVRDACPECAIAQMKKEDDERRAMTPPAEAPAEDAKQAETAKAEPRGCRNCATSSGAPDRGDFAVFGLALAFLAQRLRRRAKKDSKRL